MSDKEMARRVTQLAIKDGIINAAELEQKLVLTRKEYYAAVIEAYDQGVAANPPRAPRFLVIAAVMSPFLLASTLYLLFR